MELSDLLLKMNDSSRIYCLRDAKIFLGGPLTSQTASSTTLFEFEFEGKKYRPNKGGWKTNFEGMQN